MQLLEMTQQRMPTTLKSAIDKNIETLNKGFKLAGDNKTTELNSIFRFYYKCWIWRFQSKSKRSRHSWYRIQS